MKNRIISAVIVVICIALIGAVVYTFLPKRSEQEANYDKIRDTVTEEDDENISGRKIDFDKLKEENPDIYSWIEIAGTKVDYPVLQSGGDKEEDFYLSHNVDLSYGYPGAIYTQKVNAKNYSDLVTVIYGHNMKNGDMFGNLYEMYMDKDSFDKNSTIYIYTPDKTYKYKVFAACTYDDRLIPAYYNNFALSADYDSFLSEIKSLSESNGYIDENIDVDTDSHIIVLSTCVEDDYQRFLVNALRVN